MIVIKELISKWCQFTVNIKDRMIDTHIRDAEENKIKPVLGDKLYTAVRSISDTTPTLWESTVTYSVGQYAYEEVDGVVSVYKAIQAGVNHALTDTNYWEPSPLGNFWFNYALPWAVFESMRIFSAFHGVNFTQSGVRINTSNTDFPADGSIRAGITAHYKETATAKRKLLENFLCDNNWIIAGVDYTTNCDVYKHTAPSYGIRAAGKKVKRK